MGLLDDDEEVEEDLETEASFLDYYYFGCSLFSTLNTLSNLAYAGERVSIYSRDIPIIEIDN